MLAVSGKALRTDLAQSTLSRQHGVTIEVAESGLHSSFQRLTNRCTADSANHCTILQSNVSSGQFPSGLVKLRIDPLAVEDLMDLRPVSADSSTGRLKLKI